MNNWWREELQRREDAHLLRGLREVPAGVLDLASNDYLGLARDPEVIEAACYAVCEFGAGARASRLVSGQTSIHARLEATLAAFRRCESALVFPSGYHANLGAIAALARQSAFICCDKRNHASLIDACLLASARGATVRYYDSLGKLKALLGRATSSHRLIVSDAVYSMDGDLAPVPELYGLAENYDALLILDDAHGTGTLGTEGRGAIQHFQQAGWGAENLERLVLTGTLSKALGSQGGYVAGSHILIEWLLNAARPFVYTTGLNPGSCGAAWAALEKIQANPQLIERLRTVKYQIAEGLRALGYEVGLEPSPVIPVFIGDAEKAVQVSNTLLAEGVWCPAIRPPTVPQGSSRLRVTASAGLSDEHINQVLAAFGRARQ